MSNYDFCGWATRNNLKCSDGKTILKDAFKHCDGKKVPLVWNHQHGEVDNVLGHAVLENRDEGVYAYGYFNDTKNAKHARIMVEHGDIDAMSIYANSLKYRGVGNVSHGTIREVSLVFAGANPGAYIESVIKHGEGADEDVVIYTGEELVLFHADEPEKQEDNKEEKSEMAEKSEKTLKEIIDTMNEEQKNAMYALIGQALEHSADVDDEDEEKDESEGGDNTMKHNAFDREGQQNDIVIQHADMMKVIADAKRYGSLRESAIQHGMEDISYIAHSTETETSPGTATYGIDGINWLFPEARNLNTPPSFIQRDMGWVRKVMGGTHHTPFSRIKSMFADITEEEARAKGYIKGKLKKEEVFTLLKRTTTPTTIYKKQKLDRDDVLDITDFDVVAWLKSEMRMMLDEEIARAILVGDGRNPSHDDKINEMNIRPIWKDEDLFTIKTLVTVAEGATEEDKAKAFNKAAIKSRKNYKGSGEPTLFISEDILTDCLLIEDGVGRVIYDSVAKLATVLRVKEIVSVPVMENLSREVEGVTHNLMGLIVNLKDYNVGADKGGAVNMFDDFDIDYNAQKYLIETRCSGALIKPYSAIALEIKA